MTRIRISMDLLELKVAIECLNHAWNYYDDYTFYNEEKREKEAARLKLIKTFKGILDRKEKEARSAAVHEHEWRYGRSEKARLRARECMNCGTTQVLLTEGSTEYVDVPVHVIPVPEWLEANPHWKKHWENSEQ